MFPRFPPTTTMKTPRSTHQPLLQNNGRRATYHFGRSNYNILQECEMKECRCAARSTREFPEMRRWRPVDGLAAVGVLRGRASYRRERSQPERWERYRSDVHAHATKGRSSPALPWQTMFGSLARRRVNVTSCGMPGGIIGVKAAGIHPYRRCMD